MQKDLVSIGVRVKPDVAARIREAALADNRSVSNWVELQLKKVIQAKEAKRGE